MITKVGRNDPCPCGSGKKYKNCCMNKADNLFTFPAGGQKDDDFERYREVVENWDESRGQPPTFNEFMGRPNSATDLLSEIQSAAGEQNFESIEELQAFMQSHMDSVNNSGVDDFLGLSPDEMSTVVYGSFAENSGIVSLAPEVDPELLKEVPLVKEVLWLLQKIASEEKGFKATQKGNLPRALVHEYYHTFCTDDIGYPKFLPTGEGDCFGIALAKVVLRDLGLIKFRQKYYSTTKKGEKLLPLQDYYSFYKDLFLCRGERVSWLYYTRLPDEDGMIQHSLIFNLLILAKHAGTFASGQELSEIYLRAFPHMRDSPLGRFLGFAIMFLGRFCMELGLVEKREDDIDKPGFSLLGDEYKTTALFERLFEWHVE